MFTQERVSRWYQHVYGLLKLLILPHVECRSGERPRFCILYFVRLSLVQGFSRYTEADDTTSSED
jgi:hypothetical protein